MKDPITLFKKKSGQMNINPHKTANRGVINRNAGMQKLLKLSR